jgi:AcrR family transcriptional regulator
MNIFDKNYVKDKKRASIVQTAGKLFCSVGYRNVSIDDIGRELGLAKTIIYYYFENKADLFRCCHELATHLLEEAFEQTDQDDPVEHLRQFIKRYVVSLIGPDSPGAVLLDVELLPEVDRDEIVARREVVYKKLRRLIGKMRERRLVRDVDPKLTVLTMMGAINIIPKWYSAEGHWSPELVADYHAALFVGWLTMDKWRNRP